MEDKIKEYIVCIQFRETSAFYSLNKISINDLNTIVIAFKNGDKSFTLSGEEYPFLNPKSVKIYEIINYINILNFVQNNLNFIDESSMKFGTKISFTNKLLEGSVNCIDITYNFLGNIKYGEHQNSPKKKIEYISELRIKQLSEIDKTKFDLIKVSQFCKEINNSWENENYLSVGVLIRALKDHIPPIFNVKNFSEVANNYSGGKSFSNSMKNLENSSKNISDKLIHSHISKSVTLPVDTQVNFSQDLDVLLEEIVRLLK